MVNKTAIAQKVESPIVEKSKVESVPKKVDCLAKYIKVDLKHKPGAFKQIYRKTTEKKDCFEFNYDAASEFYVLKIMQLSLQKFEVENYRNRYSEHFDDFSIDEFVSVHLK